MRVRAMTRPRRGSDLILLVEESGAEGEANVDEEDDVDSLPYDDDAEKNLDIINNSLTNAISNVSSKDITQLVRVSDNVHEVQRLQSNLRTRQMQLESAKEEVAYTGNLVEMLRQTIDKCEKEKTKYERRIVELEEMHLKSEAKMFDKIKYFLTLQDYQIFMINEVLPGCRLDCRNFFAAPINFDITKIQSLLKINKFSKEFYIPCNPTQKTLIEV